MGAEAIVVGPQERLWGTWEELLLGGAVLRHGTRDWNVVASELKARSAYPYRFTPEACKAKYEDLQNHFSGCTAWFEELRKRRVAELKRELEKSEDSIGSLESKIEILKADRRYSNEVDCSSSQTESPAPVLRSDGNESFAKETSKDGLSAGSFTQYTRTSWSPESQIAPVALDTGTDLKPGVSEFCEREKGVSMNQSSELSNRQGGLLKKRRGKRKRKDCSRDMKEVSIGESDNLGSSMVVSSSRCKEASTSDCGQNTRFSGRDGPSTGLCGIRSNDLMEIFYSVAQNHVALAFRHRLDSQKRARYKKIIRQHVDLDIIRSRISSRSIKSARELFRDLLLLASNALVFYSKRTREYKSAMCLRDIVLKAYQQHYKGCQSKATSPCYRIPSLYNPPVKPRSARPRPCKQNPPVNLPNVQNMSAGCPAGFLKQIDGDTNIPLQSLLMAKKGLKRSGKVRNGVVKPQPKTPVPKDRTGAQNI